MTRLQCGRRGNCASFVDRVRVFTLPEFIQTGSGHTQTPIHSIVEAAFWGLKRPECEADRSSPLLPVVVVCLAVSAPTMFLRVAKSFKFTSAFISILFAFFKLNFRSINWFLSSGRWCCVSGFRCSKGTKCLDLQLYSSPWKMKALHYFESSGTTNPSTSVTPIPEDLLCMRNHSEELRSRICQCIT